MKALLLVKCFLFFGARKGADSSLRDTLLLTGAEDRAMRGRNPSADSGAGPG